MWRLSNLLGASFGVTLALLFARRLCADWAHGEQESESRFPTTAPWPKVCGPAHAAICLANLVGTSIGMPQGSRTTTVAVR